MPRIDTRTVAIIAGVAVALWLIVVSLQGILAANGLTILSTDLTVAGEFGDAFGPINTLMAMVAAISATAAFFSQRDELSRIRQSAQDDKTSSIKRDFEQTFFSLLRMFREVVDNTEIFNINGPLKGTDAFRGMLDRYRTGLTSLGDGITEENVYADTYVKYRDKFGHYFRLFYHILQHVDKSDVVDKLFYSRILRATLSKCEIALIGVNCMHGGGRRKLKPLVEQYSMLHNISTVTAVSFKMNDFFLGSAFGDRSVSDWPGGR